MIIAHNVKYKVTHGVNALGASCYYINNAEN